MHDNLSEWNNGKKNKLKWIIIFMMNTSQPFECLVTLSRPHKLLYIIIYWVYSSLSHANGTYTMKWHFVVFVFHISTG